MFSGTRTDNTSAHRRARYQLSHPGSPYCITALHSHAVNHTRLLTAHFAFDNVFPNKDMFIFFIVFIKPPSHTLGSSWKGHQLLQYQNLIHQKTDDVSAWKTRETRFNLYALIQNLLVIRMSHICNLGNISLTSNFSRSLPNVDTPFMFFVLISSKLFIVNVGKIVGVNV